jgi:hypothetical protein
MSTSPVLSVSFNQDSSHFAVALPTGFRIYSTDPLRERERREFEDGGIAVVEMLERTNWIGLVGGGRQPKYPQNKVPVREVSELNGSWLCGMMFSDGRCLRLSLRVRF